MMRRKVSNEFVIGEGERHHESDFLYCAWFGAGVGFMSILIILREGVDHGLVAVATLDRVGVRNRRIK